MSITAAVCTSVVSFDGLETNPRVLEASATSQIRQICDDANKVNGCHVSFSAPIKVQSEHKGKHEFSYMITVTGSTAEVAATRAALLSGSLIQAMVTIKTNKKIILNKNGEMKGVVKSRINEIMKSTQTQITCVGHTLADEQTGAPPGLAPDIMDVEIMGDWYGVEKARLKCLVLLDEMAGMTSDKFDVDLELQPIIAGRKKAFLEGLMQESLTSIYMSPPFRMVNAAAEQDVEMNAIYITGTATAVAETKERLRGFVVAKTPSIVRKQVLCLPKKLDWMLVSRKEHLRKIMIDNGVFLSLPSVGSGGNVITVSGDDLVFIERAIRAVMAMSCEFYVASIQLENANSVTVDAATNSQIQQLCHAALAEVVIYPGSVEIYGLQASVQSAFKQVVELALLVPVIRECKFQIELALEHKEFINGKKSGKINKIIKTCGCRIQFHENFNDYNMIIEVAHASPAKTLEGLSLLEDEFPAEMSFYIPEAFHKRIIGVGGKNIQRIMKKYGVYVKFSNAEEYATLGGYFENMDNVIARTPYKNAVNLEQLKQSIFELINIKDKTEITAIVMIPWQFHRIVMGPRAVNIKEIERSLRVTIVFPEKCLGSDEVVISGPEAQVQQARIQLHQLIPEVHDFAIPASHVAIYVIKSPEFLDGLVQRLHREFNIQVYVQTPPLDDFNGHDCLFMLYYHRGNTNIERAKVAILEFLKSKQVPIYIHPAVQRSGSYANLAPQKSYDSFQHFNSKLLSPVTSAPDSPLSILSQSYNLFDHASQFDNNLRGQRPPGAHSVPNLRQLFEHSRMLSSVEPPLQRSHSEIQPDISPTNILTSTLSAMALSTGEQPWNNSGDYGKRQMFAHTSHIEDQRGVVSSQPPEYDNSSQLDDKSNKQRIGKAPKKLSNLVIESQYQQDDDTGSPAFTKELVERVLQMDDSAKALEILLDSLDLSAYIPTFTEQEVDLNMFLTLGDADLKELGIKLFGPRKKIMNAIRECNIARNPETAHIYAQQMQQSRPPGLVAPKPNSIAAPLIYSAVEPRHIASFTGAASGSQYPPRKGSPAPPNSAIGLQNFHYPSAGMSTMSGPESAKVTSQSQNFRDPPLNLPMTAPNGARARP
ncbi:hypothetical protein HDU97_005517 [Phlyctochytrium planicorne]|nr:hypothetical protein HDU97_005517 [Phlyctochytrium planicorne]